MTHSLNFATAVTVEVAVATAEVAVVCLCILFETIVLSQEIMLTSTPSFTTGYDDYGGRGGGGGGGYNDRY